MGLLVLLLQRRKEVGQEAAALLERSWSCQGLVITTAAAAAVVPTTDSILPPDTKRTIDTDPGLDRTETVAPLTKIGK